MTSSRTSSASLATTLGIFLVVILLAFIFISGDSLWIDEGYAANKALQGSISNWYRTLIAEGGSDSQMPGYMFFIWVWAKFAGHSEMALRMSNLVWLLLAAAALRTRPLILAALVVSPFTLYYANELRPYMMQIAASAVVFGALLRFRQSPSSAWTQVLGGCLLLCLSSLLGAIWTAGILLYVGVAHPDSLRKHWFWKTLAISSPLFLLLGIYYLKTLLSGQGAAPMGGSILTSAGAAGYELLGLMGLGPGRIELRVDPGSAIRFAPVLVPAAVIMASAIVGGGFLYARDFSRRDWTAVALGLGFPLFIFTAVILLRDFRLLGRHLAPLSILVAACIARCFQTDGNRKIGFRLLPWVGTAAMIISLASASSLRFLERHRKDDYKKAAALALQSVKQGHKVLWAACRVTGNYYGIAHDNPDFISWEGGKQGDDLPNLDSGERVFLTKPDIADPDGTLRKLLAEKNFKIVRTLHAFTIWEASTKSPSKSK